MSTDTVPGPVRSDRAVGAILASAAGDALGAGYEFGPALEADAVVKMGDGGTFGWKPGEWTDDTQMALAILTPVADGNADIGEIEAGFRTWFASGPSDVGIQTSGVLGSARPLHEAAAEYAAQRPDRSAGNGSLMRTGPVALALPGNPEAIAALARSESELTHADPDCVDACVIWSVAIDHSIHHAPDSSLPWDWREVLRLGASYLDDDRRDRWLGLIDEAADGSPLDFPKNGWVVHAFQAAVAAICSTPVPDGHAAPTHLRLALENAVRAGGDTDTVAAIAGSLLGARWGVTALPFEWQRLLHGKRIYGEAELRAADLERLARLAFNGGEPDSTGWPSTESLLPYYASTFGGAPNRVTLGGPIGEPTKGTVEFGNAAALPDAIADGVDVVISLCRMGSAEVPEGVEHHVLGLIDSTPAENPNLVFLIAEAATAIETFVNEGRRVFVHCVQNENRTPAVAAAWLHAYRGLTADAALDAAAAKLSRPRPFLADAAIKSTEISAQHRRTRYIR